MLLSMFVLTTLGQQNIQKDLDFTLLGKYNREMGAEFRFCCIFIYSQQKTVFKRIINNHSKYCFNSFNTSVLKINVL